MARLLPLGLLAFLLSACASVPLPEREGVALYRAKCGGCHRPYAPQELTAAAWRQRLPEMAGRAKLTPQEFETIRRYLQVEMVASHPQLGVPRTR